MPLTLTSLGAYLDARQDLLDAREGLFQAMRTFLRPEQRIDAEVLGDHTQTAPFRYISDEEWVANPARGYITVLPSAEKGRPFRLSVLQLGDVLRVGLRLDADYDISEIAELRLLHLFKDNPPTKVELPGTVSLAFDWQFDASRVYTDVQAFEAAVYQVSAVFEVALHCFADDTI